MSAFGKWVDKKVKEQEGGGNFNNSYNLPFTKIGDTYQGTDFAAKCLGEDRFELHTGSSRNNYPSLSGAHPGGPMSSTIASLSYGSSLSMIDAKTMKSVMDGDQLPHLGLPRMTSIQKDRLETLNKEFEIWKKQQKLVKFKTLPSHIRQEIVDESIVKDLVSKINDIDLDGFPDKKELDKLVNLQTSTNKQYQGPYATMAITSSFGLSTNSMNVDVQKYSKILSMFTTEELMRAHTEACLEDEISN